MIDRAHTETDIKLAEMEDKLKDIYTRAGKEIKQSWDKYLSVIDEQIREFEKAYEDAKKSGDKALIQKAGKELGLAKREKIMQTKRYEDLVNQTAAELANVNETALDYLNGELPPIYALNYNQISEKIGSEVKGYSYTLIDQNTVKKLVMEDPNLLPTRKLDIPADKIWNRKKINSEILQGILQGESMNKIANRLQNVTEMNAKSAIRNARTMITGAENAGRLDGMKRAQDMGTVLQKEWLATNDKRTRHWHSDLNHVKAEVDEPFENEYGKIMFPGDPAADGANVYNCRCTLITKIIGFKDKNGKIIKV